MIYLVGDLEHGHLLWLYYWLFLWVYMGYII